MKSKNWTELTVSHFCKKYGACEDGRKWGLSTGAKTMAEVWRRDDFPDDYRVWVATRSDVLDHITLVKFACFCARQNWGKLTDERSCTAIDMAEAFCRGEATKEECRAAVYAAADAAAHAAADVAADAAAHAAADVAAYAAAYAAADATHAAHAAYVAAYAAAYAATDAARAEQAKWLIENTGV